MSLNLDLSKKQWSTSPWEREKRWSNVGFKDTFSNGWRNSLVLRCKTCVHEPSCSCRLSATRTHNRKQLLSCGCSALHSGSVLYYSFVPICSALPICSVILPFLLTVHKCSHLLPFLFKVIPTEVKSGIRACASDPLLQFSTGKPASNLRTWILSCFSQEKFIIAEK